MCNLHILTMDNVRIFKGARISLRYLREEADCQKPEVHTESNVPGRERLGYWGSKE